MCEGVLQRLFTLLRLLSRTLLIVFRKEQIFVSQNSFTSSFTKQGNFLLLLTQKKNVSKKKVMKNECKLVADAQTPAYDTKRLFRCLQIQCSTSIEIFCCLSSQKSESNISTLILRVYQQQRNIKRLVLFLRMQFKNIT